MFNRPSQPMGKIAFGGGCHWCTEAVFQALAGVNQVEQGFVKSLFPHDSFSEAVIVHFDPAAVPVKILVEIHLRTHASSSAHTMRGKYRSAVYCFSATQQTEVTEMLNAFSADWDILLVTQALKFAEFKASDPRFQNYQASDPERPFCKTYIDPKLNLLREEYGDRLQASAQGIS